MIYNTNIYQFLKYNKIQYFPYTVFPKPNRPNPTINSKVNGQQSCKYYKLLLYIFS